MGKQVTNKTNCPGHSNNHHDEKFRRETALPRSRYSLVTATCRLALPSSITSITSSGLDTNLSVAPWNKTDVIALRSARSVQTGSERDREAAVSFFLSETTDSDGDSVNSSAQERNPLTSSYQLQLLRHVRLFSPWGEFLFVHADGKSKRLGGARDSIDTTLPSFDDNNGAGYLQEEPGPTALKSSDNHASHSLSRGLTLTNGTRFLSSWTDRFVLETEKRTNCVYFSSEFPSFAANSTARVAGSKALCAASPAVDGSLTVCVS